MTVRHFELVEHNGLTIPINVGGFCVTGQCMAHLHWLPTQLLTKYPIIRPWRTKAHGPRTRP